MSMLDDRQIEILNKMGVDIWRRKDVASESVQSVETGSYSMTQEEVQDSDIVHVRSDSAIASAALAHEGLDQLAKIIVKCEKCPLHQTRTHAVPGHGSLTADWMFVGEAPGQNEDQQGLPFVGRAGQLLDAMISALKMQREEAFVANVIKCRPPNNRDPVAEEVEQCEPFLHQQLEIIKPSVIVALGRISAQLLLRSSEPIGKLRGKIYHYGASNIPLIPTYHPAYLLRSPEQKGKAWQDLLLAKSVVDNNQ